MTESVSLRRSIPEPCCIIFIGMAGAGKTTIGRLVAQELKWAFVDTDHIIEASFASPLHRIASSMTKEEFIEAEAEVVSSLRFSRTVIATGGSVIYRQTTMEHLASMGPVVYLDVSMKTILERIARNPDRGLAIAPGQSVEDLFRERAALYRRYADLTVESSGLTPAETARRTLDLLAAQGIAAFSA